MPYTAVIPIIALALKWVAVKMASIGLLPKAVADALNIVPQSSSTSKNCCSSDNINESATSSQGPVAVQTIESEDDFDSLLKKDNHTVVCKFTAV